MMAGTRELVVHVKVDPEKSEAFIQAVDDAREKFRDMEEAVMKVRAAMAALEFTGVQDG